MHRMEAPIRSLTEYRSRHGLTLDALGDRLGVNKTTVLRWETRIPAERVAEIARATGIAREFLRPDLFDIDCSPSGAVADPAKASAAPSASVSQDDAETLTCPTEERSHATEKRMRATA